MQQFMTIAKGASSVFLALFCASLGATAHAQAPGYVRLRSLSYAGSGCPAGSVSQKISHATRDLELIVLDAMVAQAGPGIPLSQGRKNCHISLDLDFPSGWAYSVSDADFRGYLSLERGVTGTQSVSYYFQGQAQTARFQSTVTGPADRDYWLRDNLGLSALVWSPCGAQRALNINSAIRVDNSRNRSGSGLVTADTTYGYTALRLRLNWRRC